LGGSGHHINSRIDPSLSLSSATKIPILVRYPYKYVILVMKEHFHLHYNNGQNKLYVLEVLNY
jgi:hypothetical protein